MAPRKHSEYGPSKSAIYLNCAGSVEAQRGLPDSSSTAADEGTAAHSIRETCLKHDLDPYDVIGAKVKVNGVTYECDDEMAHHLQEGIDRIRELGGFLYVEERLDLSHVLGKDEFGTLDAGIVIPEHLEVIVSDLKYGHRPVDPVWNSQQLLYLSGFWRQIARHKIPRHKWDDVSFRVIIDQPRNPQGGGEWGCEAYVPGADDDEVVTLRDLEEFEEKVRKAIAATKRPGAPRTPGEKQCEWCKAAKFGKCAEYDRFYMDQLGIDVEDLDADDRVKIPDEEGLSPDRRARLFLLDGKIKAFLKRVALLVREDVSEGRTDLIKAVEGRRGKRSFLDEDEAADFLLDNGIPRGKLFNKKLISPAQAEKLLPKKTVIPKDLTKGGERSPVLVSSKDSRPAIKLEGLQIEDLDADWSED